MPSSKDIDWNIQWCYLCELESFCLGQKGRYYICVTLGWERVKKWFESVSRYNVNIIGKISFRSNRKIPDTN